MLSKENTFLNVLLSLCCLVVVTKSDESDSIVNYVTTAQLPDEERQVRMRLGDVIVRETLVTHQNLDGVRKGLMLRQIASGPHFLQLIYKLNHEEMSPLKQKQRKLAECEVIKDWGAANKFRSQFQGELNRAGLNLQVPHNGHTHQDENYVDIDEELSKSYFTVPGEGGGDEVYKDVDPIDLDQGMDEFLNVSVRILKEADVSDEVKTSFDIHTQQRDCKRFHRRLNKQIEQTKQKKNSSQQFQPNRRVRRETFKVGIMPGTLWCGDGSLAEKNESLGAHVGADRCCREHDRCPFVIDAMSSNYGMFNYRMHTLSHCICDERFRSCLKQTSTGSANFVGKIFFNVVQTKCFLLKPERTCAKLSWWGKCLKYEHKKQAHLRDPIPY